jgi:hypothetical protein
MDRYSVKRRLVTSRGQSFDKQSRDDGASLYLSIGTSFKYEMIREEKRFSDNLDESVSRNSADRDARFVMATRNGIESAFSCVEGNKDWRVSK